MPLRTKKQETRIIPEKVPPKFFSQHLKAYEFVSSSIRGEDVLEVGCGDGYGSYYLSGYGARSVTGIDYDEDVVEAARKKYRNQNLKFLPMDAAKLDFKSESFDIVCSFQVIEHIPEDKIKSYLTEIKRVLKPQGSFYISTLNLDHAMKIPAQYKKNPAHCKEFRYGEFKALLEGCFSGVKILGMHLTGRHGFYLRLKKIGIGKIFPERINPVSKFYQRVSTADFRISEGNLKRAIDFIAICSKNSNK